MSRSPSKKSLLLKTQSEDDSYAYSEDDFEQLGSQDGVSNKFSPIKEIRKSSEFSAQKLLPSSSEGANDEEDDEYMSGDLEKYIMEMKINPTELSKQLLSLDGMKSSQSVPSLLSKDKSSSNNEGFSRRSNELSDVIRESNLRSSASEQQLPSHPGPSSKENNQSNSFQKEEEINEAQRVESLLMELFPEKYGPPAGKGKKKKKATKEAASHPQNVIRSLFSDCFFIFLFEKQIVPKSKSLFRADEDDNDSETDPTKDVLTTLDGQLKLLKKELKMKDDKIAKLTEHSMMMANHMDRLKGEIARLHGKLYDADLELQVGFKKNSVNGNSFICRQRTRGYPN
jgi:hypothetical protein